MTTANDLEDGLFARLKRLPYPVFVCCAVALLMKLDDLYQDLIPDDLRDLCSATVGEAEDILANDVPRDRMRALAEQWDALATEGFDVIDDGLAHALMSYVTAACELGELPDVPRYAALNNGTSALLHYPGRGAPTSDGIEGGLLPRVPLDSAAGQALQEVSLMVDLAERLHTLGLPCSPRGVLQGARTDGGTGTGPVTPTPES